MPLTKIKKELLFNRHFKLVDNIVNITVSLNFKNLFYDDLIQEGRQGLWEAVLKFNPKKCNTDFSYFAKFWISLRVKRFIYRNASIVHVPKELAREYLRYLSTGKKITYSKNKIILKQVEIAFSRYWEEPVQGY